MLFRASASESFSLSYSSWPALCSRFPWRASSASWITFLTIYLFLRIQQLYHLLWAFLWKVNHLWYLHVVPGWVISCLSRVSVLVVVLSAMSLCWSSAFLSGDIVLSLSSGQHGKFSSFHLMGSGFRLLAQAVLMEWWCLVLCEFRRQNINDAGQEALPALWQWFVLWEHAPLCSKGRNRVQRQFSTAYRYLIVYVWYNWI